MAISKFAKAYHERMFPGYISQLEKTDPEFMEIFDNFAFDEVIQQGSIDDKTRFIAILATLIGCQGKEEFEMMIIGAYQFGVSVIEMKEIVYQATAYVGIGRVFPFLKAVNAFCETNDIALPLAGQSTTNTETRLAQGIQKQVDIFGEGMRNFYASGPEESKHIHHWLADNCFGDYYTRNGLDDQQREMITFCFLAAQGGCEPQLTSHAAANMKIGNDKQFLIGIISQCVPYIGYPRSLNALRCVQDACAKLEAE